MPPAHANVGPSRRQMLKRRGGGVEQDRMRQFSRSRLGAAIALAILVLLAAPLMPIAAAASGCPAGARSGCLRASLLAASLVESEAEAQEEAEGEEAGGSEREGAEAAEGEEEAEEGEGEEEAARSPGTGGGGPADRRHRAAAHLSGLALTGRTRASLRRHRPAATSVAFSFKLDRGSKVRVTIARQTRVKGRLRSRVVDSFSIAAAKGVGHARLRAHGRLAPGQYRLTLAPTGGPARSIAFRVR